MPRPLDILLTNCLSMVHDKGLDGFFWPSEFGPRAPLTSGAPQFSAYQSPMGHLYLQPGLFKAYGYASESDFRADCIKGKLQAKTITGALTLGVTRSLPAGSPIVVLFPAGCYGRMIFHAVEDGEAEAIAEALRNFFPKGDVRICRSAFSAMLAGAPMISSIPSGFLALKGEARLFFAFLVTLILSAVLLLGLSWTTPRLSAVLFCGAIMITIAFLVSLPKFLRIQKESAAQHSHELL